VALTPPATDGVSAGLAAFQSESHYYYFAVRRTAGGLSVFLERRNGAGAETVATGLIAETAKIELLVSADDRLLVFAYALGDGAWRTLVPNADSLAITVQAAGDGLHFTGAVIGPYTRLEP
jgi:alpha-N-arabinofuranosidase